MSRYGSNLSAHQCMNGQRRCEILFNLTHNKKCKLKQPTHMLQWLKEKRVPLTSVGDDMEYPILTYVAGRMWNSTDILQNFLLVTCEVQYIQLYKPEISLLGIHPKEMKTYFYKRL